MISILRAACSGVIALGVVAAAGIATDIAASSERGPFLEAVRRAYSDLESLEAEFVQENDWSIHEGVQSYHGRLYATTDGRVRIEYDEPSGHLFVSDGTWHWTYVPESGQVLKARADERGAPLSRLFLDVLAGRRVSSVSAAGDLVALELEPERESGLRSLTVFVDPVTALGRRFRWTDLEGNTATYAFVDATANAELDETLFVFEPPAGVEVVELDDEGRW